MKMPEPYHLADLAIKQISRTATRLETDTKHQLVMLKFDDFNVMKLVDVLYQEIDNAFRKKCKELYEMRYREVCRWIGADEDDEIDDLVEMYLAGLLDSPNPNTHYEYGSEVLRKRDRAIEAILSLPTRAQKQIEMDKHLRYMMQMCGWYLDFVSQDAEIQALLDDGTRYVMRHEMNDSKTCRVCKEADGDIYEIHHIPELPHLRCRRWFTRAG